MCSSSLSRITLRKLDEEPGWDHRSAELLVGLQVGCSTDDNQGRIAPVFVAVATNVLRLSEKLPGSKGHQPNAI